MTPDITITRHGASLVVKFGDCTRKAIYTSQGYAKNIETRLRNDLNFACKWTGVKLTKMPISPACRLRFIM